MRYCLMAVLAFLLCACRGGGHGGDTSGGDTLSLRYAQYINIVAHDGYTVATLSDPWNAGKTLHTYVLVPSGQPLPPSLPKGTVVRTPLQKAVVATSVHCGLIGQMGRREAIAGVCDVQYINLPFVQEGVKQGRIADCGSGLQPTIEKIIDLEPDALFLSPFQNSGGYGKLEKLEIPIVEMADYMESSALGRAEWMKFYGMLFGREKEADSLFAVVEKNYQALKSKVAERVAKGDVKRPRVLMDKQTGSVWYVPGGRSTIGRLLVDAGVDYPWKDDDRSGSLPLPFESVLEQGAQSDIWLFRYNAPHAIRPQELLAEKQAYSRFKAFQRGEIYGCNTATSTFYEDTPFHPDLLLRDFITICYPDLGLGEPVYFVKVKN